MISRRLFTISLGSFFVTTDKPRTANNVVDDLMKLGTEHEKLYTMAVKRSRMVNPQGDAVIAGWFRRLGEINIRVGALFVELAELLGGK